MPWHEASELTWIIGYLVFAEMPDQLPLTLIARRLVLTLVEQVLFLLRIILVLATWLALLPYSMYWVTQFFWWSADGFAELAAALFKKGGREAMRRGLEVAPVCEIPKVVPGLVQTVVAPVWWRASFE